MIGTIVEAGKDLYSAIGPFFSVAFGLVTLSFIILVMKFREERKRLGVSDYHLQRLVRAIEDEDSLLSEHICQRVRGKQVDCPIDEESFCDWLDFSILGIENSSSGSAGERMALKKYLFGVLTSPRRRLTREDNRLKLTAIRSYLKQRCFHRFIGVVLASTAVSLGVLGTVTGLWVTFRTADFENVARMAVVMEEIMIGLSQALYTTGLGLSLSIPMVMIAFGMETDMERIHAGLLVVRDALQATVASASVQDSHFTRSGEDNE